MLAIYQGELTEVFDTSHPLLLYLGDVILEVHALEDILVTCLCLGIDSVKVAKDIAYANTIAADLVGIGGANALTCGTNLGIALGSLVSRIEHTVGRHNEVRLLGDVETLLERMARCLKGLGLSLEQCGVEDHAITYNVYLVALENSRGDGTEYILLPLKLKCMTCVRTALKTCHHVVTRRQDIYYFSFSLIAPLEA